LTIFDAIAIDGGKTKSFVGLMDRFAFADLLLVLDGPNESVERSARNIPGVTVLPVAGLNVYDVLRHSNLALTREAVDGVVGRIRG